MYVDLLFPADEIEISGIETAEEIEVKKGLKVRVFSPGILTLTRPYSENPKHLADLSILFHRGLIPVEETLKLLKEYDPPMADEFQQIIEKIAHPEPRRKPPQGFRRWQR